MLSFGNMGFPEAVCSKSMLLLGDTTINMQTMCQGTTQIDSVYDSGIFSDHYDTSFKQCLIEKPVDYL
jgi:hypothetical protein